MRLVDVGDGEKVRDGSSILRRHSTAFLLDWHFVHRRLLFGLGISPFARIRWAASFGDELSLAVKNTKPTVQEERLRALRVATMGQTKCLAKNARTKLAMSSFFSSKAKWPASNRWISASGRSRLNASPPGAINEGSFRPQTTRVGGLVLPQPRLPCRIGRDIGPVVFQQIGLDLALTWSRQVGVLVRPGVGVITFEMRGAESDAFRSP